MKKKILMCLFYVFCLFVIPRTVSADGFYVYYGGTTSTTVGGTVTYAVSVPVLEWSIEEYDLIIKYDEDVLEYYRPDDYYADFDETVSNGVITRKFENAYANDGILSFIEFKAKEEYNGYVPISVEVKNVKCHDLDGEKYELESTDFFNYYSPTPDLTITSTNDKNSDNFTQNNNTTNNDNPVDENNNDSVKDEKNDNDSNDDNKKNTNNNFYLYVSFGLNIVLTIIIICVCLKKRKNA